MDIALGRFLKMEMSDSKARLAGRKTWAWSPLNALARMVPIADIVVRVRKSAGLGYERENVRRKGEQTVGRGLECNCLQEDCRVPLSHIFSYLADRA